MHKFLALRDSRIEKNYLVYGDFRRLIPLLRIRLFPRNILDKMFLYLQSLFKLGKNQNIPFINTLSGCFPDMKSCLLFRTDWYKETQYIGFVETDNGMFFIKVFRNYEDLFYQSNQFDFIKSHFSAHFKTVSLDKITGNILVTEFVPFKRFVIKKDRIEEKLGSISRELIQSRSMLKSIQDILPIDLKFILSEQAELLKLIDKFCANNREIPVIPVHGDMTPWNIFVDEKENIVLVDYETAGWHVPFYDYFHYILQPLALKRRVKSIDRIIGQEFSKEYLVLYLIDQIYRHYSQIRQFGFNDKALRNLVENKTIWLAGLLNER